MPIKVWLAQNWMFRALMSWRVEWYVAWDRCSDPAALRFVMEVR